MRKYIRHPSDIPIEFDEATVVWNGQGMIDRGDGLLNMEARWISGEPANRNSKYRPVSQEFHIANIDFFVVT